MNDFFTWPATPEGWVDWLLIVYIAVVVLIKAIMMAKNSRFFDRLGVSLIVLNLAFVLGYLYAALLRIHPEWITHRDLRWSVRILVASAATWALWEMTRATRRLTNRREGAGVWRR